MAPPRNERVALGDGAFHYVGALVGIINAYSTRQTSASNAINGALGLGKIFVGEEGAALKRQILDGTQNIHTALNDTVNTVDDLEELGIAADQALRNIRNVDQVVGGLFRAETVKHGDPSKYDRPQYKPTTKVDDQGNEIPADQRGPDSIEAEMEKAQRIAGEIEAEQKQQRPAVGQ
jgi:hypothetical protein